MFASARRRERGGVLAAALCGVLAVALLSTSFLAVSAGMRRSQTLTLDGRRAFYVAEAGLAEAYLGLLLGRKGTIASPAAPALYGDGVFWVSATPHEDGTILLESTGLCGGASTTLELVVARVETAVGTHGMFSDSDFELGAGSFVDSYDSRNGTYAEQAASGQSNSSARIGSNQDIVVHATAGTPTVVRGSLTPGSDGSATLDVGATVTGQIVPRAQGVVLPQVHLPEVQLAPAVTHSGAVPMVIPPMTVGYEGLTVLSGGRLIIQGPASVTVGTLVAEDGAEIELDTSGGAIQLFVAGFAHLEAGASVVNTTGDPTKVTLQAASGDDGNTPVLDLGCEGPFEGLLFAPLGTLRLGSGLELFGSAVASRLVLAPAAQLHFDLALLPPPGGATIRPRVLAWSIADPPGANGVATDPFHALGVTRAALNGPMQSHDLVGVGLKINYVDHLGATRRYRGAESGFNWGLVRDVVDFVRSSPVTPITGVEIVKDGQIQVGS